MTQEERVLAEEERKLRLVLAVPNVYKTLDSPSWRYTRCVLALWLQNYDARDTPL